MFLLMLLCYLWDRHTCTIFSAQIKSFVILILLPFIYLLMIYMYLVATVYILQVYNIYVKFFCCVKVSVCIPVGDHSIIWWDKSKVKVKCHFVCWITISSMYWIKVSHIFFYQQLSQGAYNTKENRPHLVMANGIRAEVSVQFFTCPDLYSFLEICKL